MTVVGQEALVVVVVGARNAAVLVVGVGVLLLELQYPPAVRTGTPALAQLHVPVTVTAVLTILPAAPYVLWTRGKRVGVGI